MWDLVGGVEAGDGGVEGGGGGYFCRGEESVGGLAGWPGGWTGLGEGGRCETDSASNWFGRMRSACWMRDL